MSKALSLSAAHYLDESSAETAALLAILEEQERMEEITQTQLPLQF